MGVRHELILYAPFDFHYEVDLRPALLASERGPELARVCRDLDEELRQASPDWHWVRGAEFDDRDARSKLRIYDEHRYVAPSTRPAFLMKALPGPESQEFGALAKLGAAFDLEPVSLSLVMQDFGIGLVEGRLRFSQQTLTRSSAQIGDIIEEICRAAREPFHSAADRAARLLAMAVERTELPFATGESALIHRAPRVADLENGGTEVLWFHSLLVVDNREGHLDEAVLSEWLKEVVRTKWYQRSDHFFDSAFHFRKVFPLEYETRACRAVAVFGWGNTALFLQSEMSDQDCMEAVPVAAVLQFLQSFSAGLYRLNIDVIREIIDNIQDKSRLTYSDYKKRAAIIDNLRFRTELFLSLVGEQRYAYSAKELCLWDAANEAWQVPDLITYIRENISLLRGLYSKKKDMIDELYRDRIAAVGAFISVATGSIVLFDIYDTWREAGLEVSAEALLSPDILYRVLIVVVLLMIGLYFVKRPSAR